MVDYKNFKWAEIIHDESEAVKLSSFYLIPITQTTCKLIFVDDVGEKRYITALGSDANYVYVQPTPSKVWSILHPLNKIASVTIQDTAGTTIRGSIPVNDGNMVIIEFNQAISGKAILN